MSAEPEYVAETLAWCNERRAEQGKKPLRKLTKGVIGEPQSCPCGKATGLSVITATYWHPTEKLGGLLPQPVRDFVKAFDRGDLPQYEAKS